MDQKTQSSRYPPLTHSKVHNKYMKLWQEGLPPPPKVYAASASGFDWIVCGVCKKTKGPGDEALSVGESKGNPFNAATRRGR